MAKGITEKDVFEAADQVLQDGGRPTIERVRQHLGSGSPNTVNRHLESWWKRLAGRLNEGKGAVDGRPPELERAVQQIWSLATGLAEKVQSDRLQEQAAALEAERAAIAEERRKLEPEREALRAGREMLQAEMNELRTAASDAGKKAEQLQAEAKAALAEGTAFKRERDRLSAQLELARERLEGTTRHFSEKIGVMQVAHEKETRALKRNLDKSMQDQAKVEGMLEAAQSQVAKLETELATTKANNAALTRSEKQLTERLADQSRRLDEALASLRSVTGTSSRRNQRRPIKRRPRAGKNRPGEAPAA